MAKTNYYDAPEVRQIAEDLIPKYHQHLIDFDVKIRYVFIDKTPKNKGREVWGTCRKVSNLNAFLADGDDSCEPFFVITISQDVWDVLPHDKRIALVDHELCHTLAEANQKEDDDEADPVKLSTVPHDLEEFSCIVRRHGLWRDDIEAFVKAATSGDSNEKGHAEDVH